MLWNEIIFTKLQNTIILTLYIVSFQVYQRGFVYMATKFDSVFAFINPWYSDTFIVYFH